MVNSGGVFFGFSLHHLFMHINLFGHHLALRCLEYSKGWFGGFSSALAPTVWVDGRKEGLWTVHKQSHAPQLHHDCAGLQEVSSSSTQWPGYLLPHAVTPSEKVSM